jgi:hypothetical protein
MRQLDHTGLARAWRLGANKAQLDAEARDDGAGCGGNERNVQR